MAFQKGQSGNPNGKPVGTKNKKRVIKVSDFVAENNINVPKLWLEAIEAILEPEAKAKALSEFIKWTSAMPKAEADEEPVEPDSTSADILSMVK